MAAKFTAGDSIHSTRTTDSQHHPKEPKTHSVDGPRRGNTMNGMPGYINADQSTDMGGAKGGKGFGPHREGSVGERGGSGAKSMGRAGKAPGTVTKNYKSASTGKAGPLKSNTDDGGHHVHTANRSKAFPGKGAPVSKSGFGRERAAGIDMKGGGKMEKLSGKARTSYEGRRKSMMY